MTMRDQYIAAHESLIEEFLEKHPEVSWEEAYEMLADKAYSRMRENLFDKADHLRKQRKEQGM